LDGCPPAPIANKKPKPLLVDSSTQTDPFVLLIDASTQTLDTRDASTQTDLGSLDYNVQFLSQTLAGRNSRLKTLFPTNDEEAFSSHIQYLLPYNLITTLVLNLVTALHTLFCQDTPFRRLFLKILCTNIGAKDLETVASFLRFSEKTLRRSKRSFVPNIQSVIGRTLLKVKRKCRVHTSDIDTAKGILDTLAPIKSGHDYRVVTCTLQYLYQRYTGLAKSSCAQHISASIAVSILH